MSNRRRDEMYDVKLKDPYMDRNIYSDPTICPTCKLIYHNKRWFWDEKLYNELMAERAKNKDAVTLKECPACRKIKDHYPLGIVYFGLDGLRDDEVENLKRRIANEAEYETKRNPLARIMREYEEDGYYVVETTTETLAKKIAKAVQKTFHGSLDFAFSDGQKFLRIEWTRNSEK